MKKAKEKVWFYQFTDHEKLENIQKVLHRLSIESEILPPEAYPQKLGFLLGMKGFRAVQEETAEAFTFDEVLIFENIRHQRLDAVLQAFREAGIPPIRYKAVVTPFNLFWPLRRLCENMQKEHAQMMRKGGKKHED